MAEEGLFKCLFHICTLWYIDHIDVVTSLIMVLIMVKNSSSPPLSAHEKKVKYIRVHYVIRYCESTFNTYKFVIYFPLCVCISCLYHLPIIYIYHMSLSITIYLPICSSFVLIKCADKSNWGKGVYVRSQFQDKGHHCRKA